MDVNDFLGNHCSEGRRQENSRCYEFHVSQISSFCAAQQVLDDLRDRFIGEVDATRIVRELEYRCIISDGVRQEVTVTSEREVQNQILHAHLLQTCTKEALMDVSEVMIAAKGHPKMNALGEEMNSTLRGKCVFIHMYKHMHCMHKLIYGMYLVSDVV